MALCLTNTQSYFLSQCNIDAKCRMTTETYTGISEWDICLPLILSELLRLIVAPHAQNWNWSELTPMDASNYEASGIVGFKVVGGHICRSSGGARGRGRGNGVPCHVSVISCRRRCHFLCNAIVLKHGPLGKEIGVQSAKMQRLAWK